MKKKFLTTLGCVGLAIAGTVGLVGCGGGEVDPFANMTESNYGEFIEFVSKEEVDSKLTSYTVNMTTDFNGASAGTITAKYFSDTTTQKLFITCNLQEITEVQEEFNGTIYYDGANVYVDNGTNKYYYQMGTAGYEGEVGLTKGYVMQILVYGRFEDSFEGMESASLTFSKAVSGNNTYFKTVQEEGNETSSMKTESKLHYINNSLDKIETEITFSVTSEENSFVQTGKTVVERKTVTIDDVDVTEYVAK